MSRRMHVVTGTIAASLVFLGMGGGSVSAVGTSATIATTVGPVTSSLNPQPIGYHATLRANVTPAYVLTSSATVSWFLVNGATLTPIATTDLSSSGSGVFSELPWPDSFGTGSYTVRAALNAAGDFLGATSANFVQVVGPRPTSTTLTIYDIHDASGLTAQRWDTLDLAPRTTDTGAGSRTAVPILGNVKFYVDGTYVKTVTVNTATTLGTGNLIEGVHTITARYGLSSGHLASEVTKSITIKPNLVDATAVTIGLTTFYPVVDTWKDTLPITGTRKETASVAIRIYNSSNVLVRALSVVSGTGAYATKWDGKGLNGLIVPAGTYTVKQKLTDAHGATLTVTSTVTVSLKKLYYTTTTISKLASTFTAAGHYGTGSTLTRSDGSVSISAPKAGDWAGIGWEFSLPTATMYKAVSFGVYGTTNIPPARFGAQNFAVCAYGASTWYDSCFDHFNYVAFSLAWASTTLSATANVSGHYVRGMVSTGYLGTARIYKVRVVVTYGVLK